jgi:hypothetical protein
MEWNDDDDDDDNCMYSFWIYIEILFFSGKNICVVVLLFSLKTFLTSLIKPQIIIRLAFIASSVDAT